MITPSVVSTKTIPQVNISGRMRIIQIGTEEETPTPTLIAIRAISVAVSKPRREDEREGQDEDDRGVPKGKPHAHGERTLSILEQLARRIVDGDDVIRIHPVPQAKRVREESEPCEDGG